MNAVAVCSSALPATRNFCRPVCIYSLPKRRVCLSKLNNSTTLLLFPFFYHSFRVSSRSTNSSLLYAANRHRRRLVRNSIRFDSLGGRDSISNGTVWRSKSDLFDTATCKKDESRASYLTSPATRFRVACPIRFVFRAKFSSYVCVGRTRSFVVTAIKPDPSSSSVEYE